MKVFAGCFIDADDPTNTPTVHICTSEADLVAALVADAGSQLGGLIPTTLEEACEFLVDYADNSYSSFAYETKEI